MKEEKNKRLKFIMLKGLPGSGKSTFAREYVLANPNTVRISNDDIQMMAFCVPFAKGKTIMLADMREAIINVALLHDQNILVDTTNLNPEREEAYRLTVEEWNKTLTQSKYDFIVKDFTNA